MHPASLFRSWLPRLLGTLLLFAALSCGDIIDLPPTSAGTGRITGPDDPIATSDRPPGVSSLTTVPDPPPIEPSPGPLPTLARIHVEVLQPKCGACHIDRSVPSGGFSLRLDGDLRERLRAPAVQAPGVPRIVPGAPESSYLWHKVAGTHLSVGGLGERCPVDAPPLSEETMARIRDWIVRGDWQ